MKMVSTVIEFMIAAVFLFAGLSKIFGMKWQIDNYEMLKLPQWFRIVTGWTQLIGVAGVAIGLWNGTWAFWSGIWFGIMMLCAIAAHLRVRSSFGLILPCIALVALSVEVCLVHGSEALLFG
ncbi:DoxX family protein [Cohnella caldifontis]|uniref:DoxX family protein n=1 Tax=Cohnella caldifontis TaxID=3027471 RepID=UPI0023EDD48F|nr:DoxX family protein [Cohnella sp. YIM B05605]